jgi:hypothetical protein
MTARPSETTSVCLNSWATRKVVKNKKNNKDEKKSVSSFSNQSTLL